MLQASARAAAYGRHALAHAILGEESICRGGVDQVTFDLASIKLATRNELVETERGTVELVIPPAVGSHAHKDVDLTPQGCRAARAGTVAAAWARRGCRRLRGRRLPNKRYKPIRSGGERLIINPLINHPGLDEWMAGPERSRPPLSPPIRARWHLSSGRQS